MKTKTQLLLTLLLAGFTTACDDFSLFPPIQTGELRWMLDRSSFTKSLAETPDTNDFILTIHDSEGTVLYDGPYGDSPQSLPVTPGNYTVSIVSLPFTAPAFERPQYGDEKVVVVPSGESVTVKLECTLLNAGIRLNRTEAFRTRFPDAECYLKQEDTQLKYGPDETRIAYMLPEEVSVLLYYNARQETLLTRHLEARQILTLSLSVPEGSDAISMAVDTTKYWLADDFVVGGSDDRNSGDSWQEAVPVPEVASHAGEKGIWIHGYIVGGDLSSNGKTVKTSDIQKNTHLALAGRSSVTEKASCVAVELPKGSIRDALNPADHPELIGKRVYLKGNVEERYYGTTGLKGTSEYVLP